MRRRATEEDELKANVLRMAHLFRWRCYSVRRSDRAIVQGPTAKGWPDLAMARDGELLTVELKSRTGRVTREQQDWLEALSAVPGVTALVWRPQDWTDGTIEEVLR